MDKLSLHSASIDDFQSLAEWFEKMHANPGAKKVRQLPIIRSLLEQPSLGRVFFVKADNKIIGAACIAVTISTAEGGLVWVVDDFLVAEEWRNKGIGSLLAEHMVQSARENGIARITLMLGHLTDKECRFFHRHGFEASAMISMRLAFSESGYDAPN